MPILKSKLLNLVKAAAAKLSWKEKYPPGADADDLPSYTAKGKKGTYTIYSKDGNWRISDEPHGVNIPRFSSSDLDEAKMICEQFDIG